MEERDPEGKNADLPEYCGVGVYQTEIHSCMSQCLLIDIQAIHKFDGEAFLPSLPLMTKEN